ncbi:MAG: restriction endonuclease [Chloroflexi bacterium]|nr:restriction endonuclease [Chloroflexota bacterium]
MANPKYEQYMKPLLELAADGQDHTARESYEAMAERFHLTDEDRQQVVPSGRQPTYQNRVAWARSYLTKAGLLESPARGVFRLTERGRDTLNENPPEIDSAFLRRFPEFIAFTSTTGQPEEASEQTSEETPEESLAQSLRSLKATLADELLQLVKSSNPRFFEELVIDLLVAMGYGGSRQDAGQAVGRSGDDGIDGIINEDKLGLDVVYVQAKRWQGSVGRPQVQAFAGSLDGHRARKGVMITTSHFTPDAREYVDRIEKRIVLVDGERLSELMIEHDIGVSDVDTYRIKRIDLDYFPEDLRAGEPA